MKYLLLIPIIFIAFSCKKQDEINPIEAKTSIEQSTGINQTWTFKRYDREGYIITYDRPPHVYIPLKMIFTKDNKGEYSFRDYFTISSRDTTKPMQTVERGKLYPFTYAIKDSSITIVSDIESKFHNKECYFKYRGDTVIISLPKTKENIWYIKRDN